LDETQNVDPLQAGCLISMLNCTHTHTDTHTHTRARHLETPSCAVSHIVLDCRVHTAYRYATS